MISETEVDNVLIWREMWLRAGGWSSKNAKKIASNTEIEYQYANKLLQNCKRKGFDEKFTIKLLF